MNCFELCIFEKLNTTLWQQTANNTSCELLWIMYLWKVEYNVTVSPVKGVSVVNCFELCIFEKLNTTSFDILHNHYLLWIALNYVSLKSWIQRSLIEFFCHIVVNCFELCIFEKLNTTTSYNGFWWLELWIALNYVSLKSWIQQAWFSLFISSSCELLWIMYLWKVEYNTADA